MSSQIAVMIVVMFGLLLILMVTTLCMFRACVRIDSLQSIRPITLNA